MFLIEITALYVALLRTKRQNIYIIIKQYKKSEREKALIIKNLNKAYEKIIFKGFDFECSESDFVMVIGQSGVGKTTLLNIIAGLTDYMGEIVKEGEVSYMFQDDIMLENLNILDNIRLATQKDEKEICEMARRLKIAEYLKLKSSELSGGIARRASFIRAMLYDKPILLLDEPTNSLDSSTKLLIINELENQLKIKPRLTFCVTHDVSDFSQLATKTIEIK